MANVPLSDEKTDEVFHLNLFCGQATDYEIGHFRFAISFLCLSDREVMAISKSRPRPSWFISLGVFIVCFLMGVFNAVQRTVAKNVSYMNPFLWSSIHFLVTWFLAWPFTLCSGQMIKKPPTWKRLKDKKTVIFALIVRSLIGATGSVVFQFAIRV